MDNLNALLKSRLWVERRVDQVQFLDLGTVRRTIRLTLDLGELAVLQPRYRRQTLPLGWFAPWANAGAVLLDDQKRVVPYLTSDESDALIERQIKRRLAKLGMGQDESERAADLVGRARLHRKDPGIPGIGCACSKQLSGSDGWVELISDKWGCPAARDLLALLQPWSSRQSVLSAELARIVLAWQTNFVLLARYEPSQGARHASLELSYDEELRDWEPPWERRIRALERPELCGYEAKACRKLISRGGPFASDLDELLPHGPFGVLARGRFLWARKAGRRGALGRSWHVAWHQAGGLDVNSHQVDVILPAELTVVRMRMLRMRKGERRATVADQVGSRATIVAPEFDDPASVNGSSAPPLPTLFSLVITQRSSASWNSGAVLASLSGIAILAIALWWLPQAVENADSLITILLVAPALVSALLSVRAASDIAEQLTTVLRCLISAIGVLAVASAIALAVLPDFARANSLCSLRIAWVSIAVVLGGIALTLYVGGRRTRSLIRTGRRSSPRVLENPLFGEVLNCEDIPRISPPDRWLASDEGELIPWGWLSASREPGRFEDLPSADRAFWRDGSRTRLIGWIQDDVFEWSPVRGSAANPPSCW
jgi:hypothetical protein